MRDIPCHELCGKQSIHAAARRRLNFLDCGRRPLRELERSIMFRRGLLISFVGELNCIAWNEGALIGPHESGVLCIHQQILLE
jgi:hypothetical protein